MTHYEFITRVNANYEQENHQAREWLKNATRFQLKKTGVGSNPTPVRLITKSFSYIESNNCFENINRGVKLILDCYPTFSSLLNKHSNSTSDWKVFLENIFRATMTNPQRIIDQNNFKSEIKYILNEELLHILKTNRNEEIGTFIEELKQALDELKLKYESANKINEIVYQTNSEEFRYILNKIYGINQHDLPSNEGQEELAYLGLYRHAGEILIYLDVIYDNAISLGLDPYLLYRKVLIHELAHAFHHRGFDAKDQIWNQFGYSDATRVYIVEGLAQWHAMQYMIHLDNKNRNSNCENLLTIIWMSLFQAPQYRHYLNWIRYSNENIRRTIVEARAMTGSLTASTNFDNELRLNHSKSV
jgi:hypothetical protein